MYILRLVSVGIIIYDDTWSSNRGELEFSIGDGYIFRDLTHYFSGDSYYKLTINYEKIEYTTTLEKTIDSSVLLKSSYSASYLDQGAVHYFSDVAENFLIAVKGYTNNISDARRTYCKVYKMDINSSTPFEEVYSFAEEGMGGYGKRTGYALIVSADEKCFAIDCSIDYSSNINIFNTETDYSKVIALLYEGKYYYSGDTSGLLTASPSDVRPGKTFIGSSGKMETGTMEV